MPQGRKKIPFSGKQKKLQLQHKRDKKKNQNEETSNDSIVTSGNVSIADEGKNFLEDVVKLNQQPSRQGTNTANRYRLHFRKETNQEIQKRKQLAGIPFEVLSQEALEVSYEDIFLPGSVLDIPKRPPWNYSMSKEQLEAREQKHFREYLQKIEQEFKSEELSYFEMNLETWRQLWRVLEMSDIVMLIVDIRYPVLHFSPALYDYVTSDLGKDIILVLNKIDLVPAPIVLAWKHYFQQQFPQVYIVCFSAYSGMKQAAGKRGRRIGKLKMAAEGAKRLFDVCEKIVHSKVDLSSWEKKIEEEINSSFSASDNCEEEKNPLVGAEIKVTSADCSHYRSEKFKDGILTIGCVGHPNVGKSSVLNGVMGKKVVSVSRTPGHTKHFQTIYLTPTVRLCDCPGLVFPSKIPKPLQILTGCYPIAQVREPYSVVMYLAQRVPVPEILKLQHPNQEGNMASQPEPWSAFDICEAWAIKRGFLTKRTARPDVYRAANNILRLSLDGRTLCLTFYPPGYTTEKEKWSLHPEVNEIKALQHSEKINYNNKSEVGEENLSESSNCEEDSENEKSEKFLSDEQNMFSVLSDM
ncbi:guanine nucleotide-binding protein-like 1 isoform X2 [Limulus polyphemus]|uniref:Guanine nucleotide-binding protein-like 1 n=1 Tax=Limulus polyphemus TaxID=6850 RepID=A0ABM1S6E3_LIMPO|nr:guanine nucleotide-binding protein-like 1 isoform X2 [Limulus polyphemus]